MKTTLCVLIFSLFSFHAQAQEDVDITDYPHLQRFSVTYPRQGVVIRAGDLFMISCDGRASSKYFEVFLADNTHRKKDIFLGTFLAEAGPFEARMPKNVRPGDDYRIYVISGPLEAFSEEFKVVHGHRQLP